MPNEHPLYKEIESRINRIRAGYSGETYVDNFIKNIEFPCSFAVFKDINIQTSANTKAQFDTLIITPKFVCILEVKALKGRISFQKTPAQLIREVDGVKTSLKCPEEQLKRHERRLVKWLNSIQINLPIKSAIVFAFSSTIVDLPPKYSNIMMGCDVGSYIEDLFELPPTLTEKDFKSLIDSLQQAKTNYSPTPLVSTFPIYDSKIVKGLLCPQCSINIGTLYKCPTCKISRKVIIANALEDWFYLMKSTITTRECLDFLQLKDKTSASHILNRANLIPKNNGRYRFYKLFDDVNEDSFLRHNEVLEKK